MRARVSPGLTLALALVLALAAIAGLTSAGWAQADEDLSRGRGLSMGIGGQLTFAYNNEFPATGPSFRLWIVDFLGFEVDLWWMNGPSLAIRSFVKVLNTPSVDLYTGAGVAFFSQINPQTRQSEFKSTLQGVGGLAIHLSRNFVLNAEVGLLVGGSGKPFTAGLGTHFDF